MFEVNGVKIGVFAVAGPDFEALVKPERRPFESATFGDRIAAARQVVTELRDVEQVAAVVLIDHSYHQDDVALAQQVPGIDLIFGSHSHLEAELTTLPGTNTYYISPYQYGTYVAEVTMVFEDGYGGRGPGMRLPDQRGAIGRARSPASRRPGLFRAASPQIVILSRRFEALWHGPEIPELRGESICRE